MSWKRAASILALILARCGAFWVLPLGVRLRLAADGLLPSGDVQRRSLRVVLRPRFEIKLARWPTRRVVVYASKGVPAVRRLRACTRDCFWDVSRERSGISPLRPARKTRRPGATPALWHVANLLRSNHCKTSIAAGVCAVFIIMLLRWAALLLLGSHIAAGLRVQTRAAPFASSRDVIVAHATAPPTARLHAAAGAAAAAAAALAPSIAAATTEAELDAYFSTPHPEFAVALIIHWILWGKFDRRIALAYDFGGLVLFAAEPFFR